MHGYYHPQNQASRNCCRCRLPLTDAGSLNEGIGPICRKLDNELLARLIPADYPKAMEYFHLVDMLALHPETMNVFMSLENAIAAEYASGKLDWRKQVKQVEWILSFHQNWANIKALKSMVMALGYVGIVSLWNGEAATGKAIVCFCPDDGRLYVSGPQNKAAKLSLKKIYGWKFHPVKNAEERPSWSVPGGQFEKFFNSVIAHYPNFEGLQDAIKLAKEWTAAADAKLAALAAEEEAAKKAAAKKCQTCGETMEVNISDETDEPFLYCPGCNATKDATVAAQAVSVHWSNKVTVEESGEWLKVRTPYHVCFIATLKALPYTNRKWNGAEKVWEVSATHKNEVEAMLSKFFPAEG